MELKRVVVTGLGALTPLGNTVSEFWDNLERGVSGCGPITHFDVSKFKTRIACEVKNLDVTKFMDKKDARKLDVYSQYAMISADEAVADSGIADNCDKSRVGVIWATGIGGVESYGKAMLEFAAGDGTPRFSPFLIPLIIPDIAAGHISIKYGFMGPNMSVVNACASSTNAMIDALTYIRLGKADALVTGGSEYPIVIAALGGFSSMKALSERNDDPLTASRPYDKDRDGFVLGEGAGALIFEELEHAKARGAKIYCEVAGGGMSGDAYHMTAPNMDGPKRCMINAMRDAGINPDQIQYVNAHGTSTPLGDKNETDAIKAALGGHAKKVVVNSTKSMTGHLLGGAGGLESVFTVLSLHHQKSPPTINIFNQDPECDLDYCANAARDLKIDYAVKNNFGFGGTNGTLIFGKKP